MSIKSALARLKKFSGGVVDEQKMLSIVPRLNGSMLITSNHNGTCAEFAEFCLGVPVKVMFDDFAAAYEDGCKITMGDDRLILSGTHKAKIPLCDGPLLEAPDVPESLVDITGDISAIANCFKNNASPENFLHFDHVHIHGGFAYKGNPNMICRNRCTERHEIVKITRLANELIRGLDKVSVSPWDESSSGYLTIVHTGGISRVSYSNFVPYDPIIGIINKSADEKDIILRLEDTSTKVISACDAVLSGGTHNIEIGGGVIASKRCETTRFDVSTDVNAKGGPVFLNAGVMKMAAHIIGPAFRQRAITSLSFIETDDVKIILSHIQY